MTHATRLRILEFLLRFAGAFTATAFLARHAPVVDRHGRAANRRVRHRRRAPELVARGVALNVDSISELVSLQRPACVMRTT